MGLFLHWGISPVGEVELGWASVCVPASCKSSAYILERMVRNRAWGGNYLPSFGPRSHGTPPPDYYYIWREMAEWMKHSGESVDGTPAPRPEDCDAPVTVKGATWYLHLLGYQRRPHRPAPKRATPMRTGGPAGIEHTAEPSVVTMPFGLPSDAQEVIAGRYL